MKNQTGSSVHVSRSGRYFKYAIGEIVLVVIGILIALQINNWNENRKEKSLSLFYHEQLISDLEIVIASLETDMKWAKKVKTNINTTTKLLELRIANDSTLKMVDFTLANYFRLNKQLSEITSYEEMKSSGQLHLIYNKTLRKNIADYLRTHYNITNIFAELNTKVNQSEFLDPYIKFDENSTLRSNHFTYDFDVISTNKKIINTFSRYAFHWEAKYSFASLLKEDAENLKLIIQQELKQLDD